MLRTPVCCILRWVVCYGQTAAGAGSQPQATLSTSDTAVELLRKEAPGYLQSASSPMNIQLLNCFRPLLVVLLRRATAPPLLNPPFDLFRMLVLLVPQPYPVREFVLSPF